MIKGLLIQKPRGVICLVVVDRDTHLEISRLRVACPGNGVGTKAIQQVQALGRRIRLQAVADPGRVRALGRFYRRLGFRRVKAPLPLTYQWDPPEHSHRD